MSASPVPDSLPSVRVATTRGGWVLRSWLVSGRLAELLRRRQRRRADKRRRSRGVLTSLKSEVESVGPGRYTGFRMERVRLTPPEEKSARGGRARLYLPSMPPLGAEAVALYELLRILPDLGNEAPEIEELAELLRSSPEGVEASLKALIEARFVVSRDGWLEVAEHPPSAETNERHQIGRASCRERV